MEKLTEEIIQFFERQNVVLVSSCSLDGSIHNSCKGIVKIERGDLVYLLDLYKGKTYENLKRNPNISITAFSEHRFEGYCLKGEARIVSRGNVSSKLLKAWEAKITSRITQRILRNIRGEKGHFSHPEALLPKPEYLIAIKVKEVVDLRPK